MAERNKLKDFKMRLTENQKETLQSNADDLGIDMSKLVRKVIFDDGKLIILSEGKKIASELYNIRIDLDHFIKNGKLPRMAIVPLMESFDSLCHEVFVLSEKLTDIQLSDELEE